MKLVIIVKNQDQLTLELRGGQKVFGRENLTISQGFDNMLIVAIDKLLASNRIDRLSLKSLEIRGKIRPEAVSSMVLKSIVSGLEN